MADQVLNGEFVIFKIWIQKRKKIQHTDTIEKATKTLEEKCPHLKLF